MGGPPYHLMHQKVLDTCAALEAAGIPYAVGGAIVIAYCTEPRTTTDIDVNVFLDESLARRALDALLAAGIPFDYERVRSRAERDGQARFNWDGTFVDLFFMNVPFHGESASRVRRVPFGNAEINILACEDLVVYKAMFNRPRDWVDIESIVHGMGPAFDAGYARGWLVAMAGGEDARVKEFDSILAEALAAEAEDDGVPSDDE
jgi:hypothetical protein